MTEAKLDFRGMTKALTVDQTGQIRSAAARTDPP